MAQVQHGVGNASINDAIEYFELFAEIQKDRQDSEFRPLNVACVFSPPAEGNKDVQQIQEDLPQEEDNQQDPDGEGSAHAHRDRLQHALWHPSH
nr:hypothetical protein [Escherichia coli]